MHTGYVVAATCNQRRLRQKGQKLKVILSYARSFRLAYDTGSPDLRNSDKCFNKEGYEAGGGIVAHICIYLSIPEAEAAWTPGQVKNCLGICM